MRDGGGRAAFRPDVEGLRGVAILLVVLFHAGVAPMAGGFVGVDVFFVLSGFFITGLLARELISTGRVELGAFYGRRAARLLPPLLLVLLVTLAAVTWLYAPIDRAPIAGNARAVALYSGNIDLARHAVDYFSSGENPLLHTWSLAVEEQFYLVWPLLFVLVAAIGVRSAREMDDAAQEELFPSEPDTRKRLLVGIITAGALSLMASVWLTRTAQPSAFFGMPTRIWEFALGGALVLLLPSEQSGRRGIALVLQAAGLAAIAIAVALYDRATPYPGFAALLPAIGAVALLAGGQWAPDNLVSRALSAPWLRWLGRLSYAWYLWHWPLVGLGGVLDPRITVWGNLAWSVAALLLAWLTHRFIEQPARTGWMARIPAYAVAPAALGASVAAAMVAHGAMHAAQRAAASPEQRVFAAARTDRMEHDCWVATVEQRTGPCEFGDRGAARTLALLGDSHAEHWLGALDRAGREHGWKVVAMVKGGCPVAEMPEMLYPRLKRYYHECTRYREAMIRRIIAMRPTAVILSSWDHYMPPDGTGSAWQVTPEIWRRGLRRTYARLAAAGIPTIVIRGTPRTWFDVPSCLSRRAAGLPFAGDCAYDRARSLSSVAVAAQNAAARGLPIHFVDMNDQICGAPRCGVVRGGVVVFTDDNHLTRTFSRSVAPVLGVRLEAALAGSTRR